ARAGASGGQESLVRVLGRGGCRPAGPRRPPAAIAGPGPATSAVAAGIAHALETPLGIEIRVRGDLSSDVHGIVQSSRYLDNVGPNHTIDQKVPRRPSDVQGADTRQEVVARCAARNFRTALQPDHGSQYGLVIDERLTWPEV